VVNELKGLRGYENFPLTDAEYRQMLSGEVVFRGRQVPGTPLLEGVVGRVIELPAWKLWRVVVDENHHNEYMPQLKYACVLKGRGHGRLIYDFLDIPMVSDRQWVVETTQRPDLWKQSGGRLWYTSFATPANQKALIDAGLADGRIPNEIKELQEDAVTIRTSRASYTLIELGPSRSILEYRAFSDPAGQIPATILNYGAPATMKKLVAVVEERTRKADAHFAAPGHPFIPDPLDRAMGQTAPARP
jgi:hypothetical protein